MRIRRLLRVPVYAVVTGVPSRLPMDGRRIASVGRGADPHGAGREGAVHRCELAGDGGATQITVARLA